jgi:hypothetical protein
MFSMFKNYLCEIHKFTQQPEKLLYGRNPLIEASPELNLVLLAQIKIYEPFFKLKQKNKLDFNSIRLINFVNRSYNFRLRWGRQTISEMKSKLWKPYKFSKLLSNSKKIPYKRYFRDLDFATDFSKLSEVLVRLEKLKIMPGDIQSDDWSCFNLSRKNSIKRHHDEFHAFQVSQVSYPTLFEDVKWSLERYHKLNENQFYSFSESELFLTTFFDFMNTDKESDQLRSISSRFEYFDDLVDNLYYEFKKGYAKPLQTLEVIRLINKNTSQLKITKERLKEFGLLNKNVFESPICEMANKYIHARAQTVKYKIKESQSNH